MIQYFEDLKPLAADVSLTPREIELLELVVGMGLEYKKAAASLGMKCTTAKSHMEHIFEKFDTYGRARITTLLWRYGGWIDCESGQFVYLDWLRQEARVASIVG